MNFRFWRLLVFSLVCLILICLVFVWNFTSQDGPKPDPRIKLTGPDLEEFLTCSVPAAFPLDVTVWWYADGVIVDSELLIAGLTDSYVSVGDLIDAVDRLPYEVQCSISDEKVGYDNVMSNIVSLLTDDEDED
ncbi:hypothetical protein BsWGS_07934 [Bradybaena similaris]